MPFRRTQKLVIAVPYYNHPDLLYRTVDHLAALGETGRYDLTVIISDDASPEAPNVSRLKLGNKLRYIRQPKNLGLVGNYNQCVQAIRAEGPAWSLILDADDIPMEAALAEVAHSSHPEDCGLIVGGYKITDVDRPDQARHAKALTDKAILMDSMTAFRWFYPHNRAASSGVWIHSDAYANETYDPACHYCCDWDMYIRLSSRSCVILSPEIFCTVLHHSNNNTWKFMKSGEARRNERKTLLKNWPLAYHLHLSAIQRLILKTMAEIRYFHRAFQMRFLQR